MPVLKAGLGSKGAPIPADCHWSRIDSLGPSGSLVQEYTKVTGMKKV